MNVGGWMTAAVPMAMQIGLKITGAIVLYIIGRWLIGIAIRLTSRVLTARNFDSTLQR